MTILLEFLYNFTENTIGIRTLRLALNIILFIVVSTIVNLISLKCQNLQGLPKIFYLYYFSTSTMDFREI